MGVPNYVVKSIKLPPSDILNNKIDIESNITEFKRIVLKNKFLKIYSDGKGNYQNIK